MQSQTSKVGRNVEGLTKESWCTWFKAKASQTLQSVLSQKTPLA